VASRAKLKGLTGGFCLLSVLISVYERVVETGDKEKDEMYTFRMPLFPLITGT